MGMHWAALVVAEPHLDLSCPCWTKSLEERKEKN